MTRNDILTSKDLKKRFCKNYNIPITVFDEPYFSERIDTLDRLYGCKAKFESFCDELKNFGSVEDYFEFYNNFKETLIQYIASKPGYERFDKDPTIKKCNHLYPNANVYHEENYWKSFISIDMKQGNFSSLRYYDPTIFDNCKNWSEFVSKFTQLKHIQESKYIRQVVMGALNPKRQIHYMENLMHQLFNWIENAVPSIQVYSLGVDEIILYHPSMYIEDPQKVKDVVDSIRRAVNWHPVGEFVRIEEFDLEGCYAGYQKIDMNDAKKVTFKCFNADTIHQYVKHWYGEPITENDLVFYHNGELAKFLNPIYNPYNPVSNS